MKHRLALMVYLMLLLAIAVSPTRKFLGSRTEQIETELKRFKGDWQAVALEAGDCDLLKMFASDSPRTIRFEGTRIFALDDGTVDLTDPSSFSPDPSKEPKAIDLAWYGEHRKRVTAKGIYKLTGSDLKIAVLMHDLFAANKVGRPADERPLSFDRATIHASGAGLLVCSLKRVKQ